VRVHIALLSACFDPIRSRAVEIPPTADNASQIEGFLVPIRFLTTLISAKSSPASSDLRSVYMSADVGSA
jgi:hypothetical protein